MKAYMARYHLYWEDKYIECFHSNMELLEIKPKEEDIEITWDNLEEIQKKYGPGLGNIYKRKKGLIFRNEKQWKTHSLNYIIKVRYKEIDPPINWLLNYWEGSKAIQYLSERGLNIYER